MSEIPRDQPTPPAADVAIPAAPTLGEQESRSTARAFGLVTIAIFCSRILGLVREVLLNALFAGEENRKWLDCFVVAFRTPNMLRDLFAEGALSTAFVTVFTKKIKTEGDEAAWRLGRKMLTLGAVFMSLVALLGVLLAPFIIPLLAHGWKTGSPEKVDFAILLAQIMYPFILLVSLGALVMGMLNARKVFFMPAMASTFFNIGSMAAGALIGWWIDPTWGRGAVIGFAIGTLAGGLLQLLVQLPSLRRVGFRFRPDFAWRDSGVRNILHLMWPAVISGSVVQVNVLLNTIFASYVGGDGPVLWLNNAFRLLQLPLGLFGVGLATVSLPTLAGHATSGISPEFKFALAKNLRFVALLSLPSSIGLMMLAEPIMSVIYGHGAAGKDPIHIHMCALALQTYAIGLVFFSGLKVIQPAFYAVEKRFVPMVVSLICVAISAVLNWMFVIKFKLGHEYLALSTSITAALNFALLFLAMRRHARGLHGRELLNGFIKLVIAASCMAVVCWLAQVTVLGGWAHYAFWLRLVTLGGTIAVAAAVYFGVNVLLKNEEVAVFASVLKRKVGRK
jgi:putative peptidoglycan lipid II flippase